MSLAILLDSPQTEFYTNLDDITGRIVLTLTRPEAISTVTVKLEGESKSIDLAQDRIGAAAEAPGGWPGSSTSRAATDVPEIHKVLYKVQQVFPDAALSTQGSISSMSGGTFIFQPGRYEYRFRFKIPLNNACGNRREMVRSPTGMSTGYHTPGQSLLGGLISASNSIRVADGSKQLLLPHVTKTLPPTLAGLRRAEVLYYVKVTVQRPGFLRENWRRMLGIKLMPVEPERVKSSQEAFARRPFAFSPMPDWGAGGGKKATLFDGFNRKGKGGVVDEGTNSPPPPPTILMAARLPHPVVLTCNQPVPLKLVATKKTPHPAHVHMTSLQIDLVGTTHVSCLRHTSKEVQRWVVVSEHNLAEPLSLSPDAPEDSTFTLSSRFWRDVALPNTATPSFQTCNLSRTYALEIKLGVSWGATAPGASIRGAPSPQTLFLPLVFKDVAVYSGIAPPPSLVHAQTAPADVVSPGPRVSDGKPRPSRQPTSPAAVSGGNGKLVPPALPPRNPRAYSSPPPASSSQAGPSGAQFGGDGGEEHQMYDEPPPSYDEAMAESVAGPSASASSEPRPTYSAATGGDASGASTTTTTEKRG